MKDSFKEGGNEKCTIWPLEVINIAGINHCCSSEVAEKLHTQEGYKIKIGDRFSMSAANV